VSNHSLWIDFGLTVIYYLRKPTLGFTPFVVQHMPPNQVTYLKGSSMDSFTLGLLPKIDFNTSTATAHRQQLES
jgi:hypothetical protein